MMDKYFNIEIDLADDVYAVRKIINIVLSCQEVGPSLIQSHRILMDSVISGEYQHKNITNILKEYHELNTEILIKISFALSDSNPNVVRACELIKKKR